MQWRFRYALSSILFFAVAFIGCGGSGGGSAGPINGPFNNSSLSGAYAFSFTGVNTFGFLAVAGSFQANGSGAITGGVADINSGNGVFTNQSLSGSYNVHNNGQGTATFATSTATFDINFVIVSGQRALIIRFDNNSTASGSIDRQNNSAFSPSALGGTFAFSLSGIDAGSRTLVSAGAIDNDGAGGIPSGVQDLNDNGSPTTNQAVTGTYSVSSTNGRGILTLNTVLGTLTFAFYVVDSNRLKLIEIDNVPVLAGDAFRQQFPQSTGSVSGPLAFTLGGAASSGIPFVVGGVLSTDGSGHVTSGTQDINNNGGITQNVALTGTYSVGADGRGFLTLNGSSGTTNFIIYPTTSGVQLVQVDVGESSIGTAFSQSGPFSTSTVSGTYGLNLTGVLGNNEIDSTAQFSADGSGHLNGAMDVNNGGALLPNLSLSGNSSIGANGRGTGQLNSSFGPQNVIFYAINSSRVLFIEVDSDIVAVGELEHQ